MEDQLANFIGITNCQDPAQATQFLEMANGDLQQAVTFFFEFGGAGGATPNPPAQTNNPPPQQRNFTLLDLSIVTSTLQLQTDWPINKSD